MPDTPPIVLTPIEPRRHVRCHTPGPCVHCTVETHWAAGLGPAAVVETLDDPEAAGDRTRADD